MKIHSRVKCAVVGAALAAGAIQASAAETIHLKVHHFLPPTSNTHVHLIVPWCDKLARESDGQLKCQLYPAMQLGGTPAQLFDQVKDGVADIVWTVPSYQASRFPVSEALDVPFIAADGEKSSRALWIFASQYAQSEYAGVKPLLFHTIPGTAIHTIKKPVKTLSDFKGLKIRAGSRLTNKLIAALGATPVGMPAPQVPEALSRGVVDGAMFPWEVLPALRLHELTSYHTESPSGMALMNSGAFVLAMNPARYDSLPAHLKKVIDANSGAEASAWAGQIWDMATERSRQVAIDHGNHIYTLPPAEQEKWEKAAESVTAEWVKEMAAKGYDAEKLLAELRALMD
ncbi:TRAP transporter substrate-binding protein [Thauera aromatica]|uniref:TRAP transporter solute receptor n=1 Tax=Thauera aromatica K172 TaxID=44139 RepID=A0A2R4BRI5_THAAR|nr:TRAP transporter substrate-binding protein [Thauera aromatica]AVR89823.1 TRAP transporter solute receptor [Thauera aromatica K172]MCK2095918.1 TRAP transporter substrate-binding protein [Thauera aromatica]